MRRFLTILFLMLCAVTAQARFVEGRVHCGSHLLGGVIVTDGVAFTTTNGEGLFKLDISFDSKYISVVTPEGFVAKSPDCFPRFWQETEGRHWFDFDLLPASPSKDFTLMAFSGPEVSGKESLEWLEGIIPDIANEAVSARIKGQTVGIIAGDIARGSVSLQDKARAAFEKVKIPFYSLSFGPEDYAFYLGGDLIVCMAKDDGDFLVNLLKYIPLDRHIFVITNVPFPDLLKGRKADIISIKNNFCQDNKEYEDGIMEHNLPSLCGEVPSYSVFTRRQGVTSWVCHPEREPEIIIPGDRASHPNELIVNCWDYDSAWKLSWQEDGIPKGSMIEVPYPERPNENLHYFSAPAGRYAREVTVEVENRFGKKWTKTVSLLGRTDIQARVAFRDKTLNAFLKEVHNVISLGANTIETSLQLSSDGKPMICRDSYPKYNDAPGGLPAGDFITAVEKLSEKTSPLYFSFALNSGSGPGEGTTWPDYKELADKCLAEILKFNLGERLIIESYDDRILNYIHSRYPDITLCYLVDTDCGPYSTFMGLLDFVPQWLGVQYELLSQDILRRAREAGMKVAVWDVSTPAYIQKLLEMKLDAIITVCIPEKKN